MFNSTVRYVHLLFVQLSGHVNYVVAAGLNDFVVLSFAPERKFWLPLCLGSER